MALFLGLKQIFWIKSVHYTYLYYYKHDYSHFNKEVFVVKVSRVDSSYVFHNSNLNNNGEVDRFYNQRDSFNIFIVLIYS